MGCHLSGHIYPLPPKCHQRSRCSGSPEKYAALNQHYNFTLVAIETAGPFGSEAFAFLRELGCRLKQVTGKANLFSYLRQRLSQCNGRMPLQQWEQWGAPPPLLISFLYCLFLLGTLSASPLTVFTYLLRYIEEHLPNLSIQH